MKKPVLQLRLFFLQAFLFCKNPVAFIRKYRHDNRFNSSIDKLEGKVKKKHLDRYLLKAEMNEYAGRKLRSRKLTDYHLQELLSRKFGERMEDLNIKGLHCEKGRVAIKV